jgi:hypothetical protein
MPEYEYRLVEVSWGVEFVVRSDKRQTLYASGWNQTPQYVTEQGEREQGFPPVTFQVWRRERSE